MPAPWYRSLESMGALLPGRARIRLERRLRGWLEARRLAAADLVVVSFGKSGRTWLRVMLSHVLASRAGLPPDTLLDFDDFRRRDPTAPAILFTHDNYLGDWTGNGESKRDYDGHSVVFLARDPADVAVSQYFQWKHRMRDHKKHINDYPRGELSLDDFVMSEQAGVPKVIRFMNAWAAAADRVGMLLVRYEDLRADTAGQLERVLAFAGIEADAAAIDAAVAYAAFENMKRREAGGDAASERLRAADTANPDSFKSRRGKVGGYRDYFDAAQCARIDALIARDLDARFGYGQRG
jgi:hypothetical protein